MAGAAFSGVLTAIATPFQEDLSLDEAGFVRLLKMQKKAGIHGVVVAGTTGESPTLQEHERERLVRLALSERSDDFKIYVGTGTNDTRTSIEASVKYTQLKEGNNSVDGVMAVVPYYNKPPQAGLFAHFKAIAQAIPDGKLCVYNVPGRTGAALQPQTFVDLARSCANIVAIKEAAGDVRTVTDLARGLNDLGRPIEILSGDDPTYAPALLCGATGVISVTTHLIPDAMLQIWQAWKENNLIKVTEIHQKSFAINTQLFCAPNPVALKWALAHLGICRNVLRPPLSPLESREVEVVKSALMQTEKQGLKLALV